MGKRGEREVGARSQQASSPRLACNLLSSRPAPPRNSHSLAPTPPHTQQVRVHTQNNTTTARGLLTLFEAIGKGQAVSPSSSAQMVEILKRQKFVAGIPAGLPPGTPVAHKTGSITRIRHDAGIVYSKRPYVLVVLTRGFQDSKLADALIASISRELAR